MSTLAIATIVQQTTLPLGLSPTFSHLEKKVRELDSENLEYVIQRLIRRESMDEALVRKLRVEFLRFVSLDFVTREPLSPSPWVDEFWHAFILFTENYTAFCKKHVGRYFHHRPQDHSTTKALRDGTPGMRTKNLIMEMYPDYDREIWAETAICSNSHCDTPSCSRG